MEGVYLLAALSLAMFSGSYLAGLIPLAFSMSESRVRVISIFGAGLLVGTALSVIIPEGVEVLYTAKAEVKSTDTHHIDAGRILEKNAAQDENPPRLIPQDAKLNEKLLEGKAENLAEKPGEALLPRKIQQFEQSFIHGSDEHGRENGASDHQHEEEDSVNEWAHKSIGFSLVVGFLMMLVIDQISRAATGKGGERSRFGLTATIGLVVHAAADGVALSSASATNRTDVQFIVFLAIMLHKAPAAFGLVSFLLVEGLERVRVKRHLLVFSLSAPVTAMLTFYVLVALGNGSSFSSHSFTGVLMLFSAGTFLYVATVHVLPELTKVTNDYQLVGQMNMAGHSHSGGGPSFTVKELVAMIIGALFPAVIASGHSHSH